MALDAAPVRLGRYELLARIATGGMGEIFLSRLEGAAGFEKLFVIKRILPHLADDPRFREMLIGEARVASMMTHANICHVYELGETDGQLYIVMEYLEGTTMLPLLRRLSKQGHLLELGFIAGVIQQVTDGLHYAHELCDRDGDYLGIVHRDVNPANIFMTDSGIVKLLDFGIAKVKNAQAHTQTGTVKGKYAYMAPEQLRGAPIDRRADVFALGVVAYEMLALRRLFQRKTDYLTFRAVMEQPIMDVRRYRPDCPPAFAHAMALALEREPDHRIATARQFAAAVLDAVSPYSRPWTAAEIGDYVSVHFAEDLRRRSGQIAITVREGPLRASVPSFALSPDDPLESDEDTQTFAPVESGVFTLPVPELAGPGSELSIPTPVPAHMRRDSTAPTIVSEPPRLPSQPWLPPPALEPPRLQSQPVIVVAARRSVAWPLFGLGMIAVTGVALYLVWYERQRPTQTSVVIENGSGGRVIEGRQGEFIASRTAEPAAADVAAGDSIDGSGGAAANAVNDQRREAAIRKVVVAHGDAASRCVAKFGALPPSTRMLITILPDGTAKQVEIVPAKIGSSELANCIKRIFEKLVYPPGDNEHIATVTLSK